MYICIFIYIYVIYICVYQYIYLYLQLFIISHLSLHSLSSYSFLIDLIDFSLSLLISHSFVLSYSYTLSLSRSLFLFLHMYISLHLLSTSLFSYCTFLSRMSFTPLRLLPQCVCICKDIIVNIIHLLPASIRIRFRIRIRICAHHKIIYANFMRKKKSLAFSLYTDTYIY